MIDPPKTLDEARKYRYGVWAGNPEGHKYKDGFCAYEVPGSSRRFHYYQCNHSNGKGINGLYCGVHAKKVGAPCP